MLERTLMIMNVPAHTIVVGELARQLKVHRTIQYDQASTIIDDAFNELREPEEGDLVNSKKDLGGRL